jgi:hypothetical protein
VQGDAIGSAQPGAAAEVALGAEQVHAFLCKSLRGLMWDAIKARCKFEVAQSPQVLFGKHAIATALDALSTSGSPARLRMFRPLLHGLMLSQLTPGRELTAQPLLEPAVLNALKRMYLHAQIRGQLHEQVLRYPDATLTTLAPTPLTVFSCHLHSPAKGSILIAYGSHGQGHDRIAVRAMPGASCVDSGGALFEHAIEDVSLAEVGQVVSRFWGLVEDCQ